LISKLSFSQEIFISGKKTDRALRWADFTGKVDVTSTFMANTFYNVSYTYDAVRRNGERAKIINLLVKL
jgi:hypothetical protein